MKTNVHKNSLEAYRSLNLNRSQDIVARAIRRETKAGRASTIDSLFRRYALIPSSTSARIGELRKMAEAGEAFRLDDEDWALVMVGKVENESGRIADSYKLEQFAVVRQAWIERQQALQIGVQTEMQL